MHLYIFAYNHERPKRRIFDDFIRLKKENGKMGELYLEKYKQWCENSFFDEATRNELKALTDDKEIKERFYKDLEFGTGGLRGQLGAGTNRLNIYTVRKASQGLANYINKQGKKDAKVVIAYDSRRMSPEFALETALTFAANNIKAYVFTSLRPTPELSFAVRKLGCIAGVVITASHNPPEYNGYKAYWEDGAQVSFPRDKEVIDEVNAVGDYSNAKTMDEAEAKNKGLLEYIDKEIDDAYIETVKAASLNAKELKDECKNLKIVYTPLHGTGLMPVKRILSELGFENVNVVEEQATPDGNFPTVGYPNPEDPKAFELALKKAKEIDADVILATDPDADRLGVYAKDTKTGEYVSFTGNMSGMIIAEYILSQRKAKGTLPKNGALVKTIVTTNLADAIAKEYGVELVEVLTGFKYIGERILHFEKTGCNEYVFGLEESYGCLIGTYARDKDAVAAVMMLCEAAAFYKKQGLTLWDQMLKLYEKYGCYREALESVTIKGMDGIEKIKSMMKALRGSKPSKLGDFDVLAIRDYNSSERVDLKSGEHSKIDLVKSDVLYYELSDNAWCCVRPSGTEPKIKFYIGATGNNIDETDAKTAKVLKDLREIAG